MKQRKNILLIVAHDLGQHIGPYGVKTVNTPNLERMAARGTLFEKNFCTSPGCSPSRAAIFTGRYPHCNGVMGLTHADFLWRLNANEKHLAQVFKENGYDTCLLGNWHENNRINNVGYQTTVVRDGNQFELSSDVNQNATHPSAPDLAARADFYFGRIQNSDTPFFMYAGIFEPHRPFDFAGCVPDTEKGCWIPPYIPQETPEQRTAAEKEFGAVQGCIKQMDEAVGKLLDSLEAHGLKENTVVLFTSDHGLAMPRAKCTLYDAGIETPLILWGGGVPENIRYSNLISNVDYFPSLLEWANLPVPANVQGRSFMPQLTGRAHQPREEIFAEKTYHRDYDPIRCIRTERYKYIINFELNVAYDAPSDVQQGEIYRTAVEKYMELRPRYELYDLSADPWEQNNLSGMPEQTDVEKQLKEKLISWMKETGDPLLNGPVRSFYNRELLMELCR
ncbi:MAG: sulfatase [Kiritimatiellales bacterium]